MMRMRLQAGAKGGSAAATAPGAENVNPEQNERPTKKRKGKAKKGAEDTEATGKHSQAGLRKQEVGRCPSALTLAEERLAGLC